MGSVKLGEDVVVLESVTEDWGNRDDFGNPAKVATYTELRWCQLTPTRSSESDERTTPTISGATLLAPPMTGIQITSADVILTDWTKTGETYTGRRWQVDGEIGEWPDCVEVQLRRAT